MFHMVIEVTPMAWKLFQVSNGHKSLENFELEAADVPAVLYQLKEHFQKRLDAGSKVGIEVLSAAAAEVWIDGSKLTVGWDNWSGLFAMAWDADGDRIVREIEGYMQQEVN